MAKSKKGKVTTRDCECCGHHEVGVTNVVGEFIPLKSGMTVEVFLERKVITAYVGGGVVCPSCGNHNALLDYADYDEKFWPRENDLAVWFFECRDCHYRIRKDHTIVKIMEGEGTGPDRVYKEVERRDGEHY